MNSAIAERFVPALAALAQPTRLRIMDVVAGAGQKGMAAGAIARALRCPASTLSFHLKELAQAGLLEAQPHGRFIIYAVRPAALSDLSEFIGGYGVQAPARKRGSRKRKVAGAAARQNQLSMFSD